MELKYWKEYLLDNLKYSTILLCMIIPSWICWWIFDNYNRDSISFAIFFVGCVGLFLQWIFTFHIYFEDRKVD